MSTPGGGWPRGIIPDNQGPNQHWVQTIYHYRSLYDGQQWRAVNSMKDGGEIVPTADMFSDPRRGVSYHHKSGYNVAYTDRHSEFVTDLDGLIENLGGGASYNTDYTRQDYVWKTFFDKVMKYAVIQEY